MASESSGLLPAVSVVMPVRNGADTIVAQLVALTSQDYRGPLEILVADNGSTDDTAGLAARWDGVHVLDAGDRVGTNYARNVGARAAAGELILTCDADDVVSPRWVSAMAAGLADAHMVGGPVEFERLNPPDVVRPAVPQSSLLVRFGFLPTAYGANFGIRASTLAALNYWDEAFEYGGDDAELCWRGQLAGYDLAFVPDALVHKRLRHSQSSVVDQAYRGGKSIPILVKHFRGRGLPLRGVMLPAFRFAAFLVLAAPAALLSRKVRVEWLRRAALAAGFAQGVFKASPTGL